MATIWAGLISGLVSLLGTIAAIFRDKQLIDSGKAIAIAKQDASEIKEAEDAIKARDNALRSVSTASGLLKHLQSDPNCRD
jgi:hypothetical protein